MENLKSIIESLLFVSDEPVSFDRLKTLVPEAETGEIKEALAELVDTHEKRNGGFYLIEVAKGFQFRSRPEFREWIARLIEPSPVRLSKAALETLAIIAYRQPVIRADIEHIRGVDSGGILRMLLERKLVRVLGRRDIPGRPLIYATTNQFLELFGLRDLKDLPSLKEIQEFGREPEEPLESSFDEISAEPPSTGSDPEPEMGDGAPDEAQTEENAGMANAEPETDDASPWSETESDSGDEPFQAQASKPEEGRPPES